MLEENELSIRRIDWKKLQPEFDIAKHRTLSFIKTVFESFSSQLPKKFGSEELLYFSTFSFNFHHLNV